MQLTLLDAVRDTQAAGTGTPWDREACQLIGDMAAGGRTSQAEGRTSGKTLRKK